MIPYAAVATHVVAIALVSPEKITLKPPAKLALLLLTAVLAAPIQAVEADDPAAPEDQGWFQTQLLSPDLLWSVDYRAGSMVDSCTSYEFGDPDGGLTGPYTPLSRLDFDLDSAWHGLQVAVEMPTWRAHVEWLTPLEDDIDGVMADYDWNIYDPRDDPSRLDSLTHSSVRWNEGQMFDVGVELFFSGHFFTLPFEFWPTAGFRFQRFDITAYNLDFLVPATGPEPSLEGVDVITFNQQYYVGYFGGQLRTTRFIGRIPIQLTFQGDAGPAAGYNVDHHLLREGDRYTMEDTHGAAWRLGMIAEAHVTRHLSVGFQADHLEIRTKGTHRLLNTPLDMDYSWDYGVMARSWQTSLMGFVRARF